MPAGSTRVTFDLTPEGEGTRVRVLFPAVHGPSESIESQSPPMIAGRARKLELYIRLRVCTGHFIRNGQHYFLR